jgi:quinoprotein glucose dehydrogenase
MLAKERPEEALPALEKALTEGTLVEKQGAFAALADEKAAGADKIVADWLDQLLAKKVPGEVVLDLVEAAAKRPGSNVKERLQKYEATRGTNPVDRYRESLAGGDAEAGRRVFAKAELSCVRCHKVGTDGGEVGPNLTGIGTRQPRDYLLESIVEPNKQIAKGFETVVLLLNNGQSIIGVLKSEDKQELKIITAEGKPMTIPLNQIDERTTGKSAMPEDLITRLTKSELRDLVEYLASLKESPKEK